MSLLTDAKAIAALGWPVFPCGRSKRPCIPKAEGGLGFHDASLNPSEIERLFASHGAAMIGVPAGDASGFDVLDLDYRNGAGLWEEANADNIPETRIHRTPSGGRHYLFRHAPGVYNSESKIHAGVDVRGSGGYACVPPSPGYTVESDAEIAEWPDWLLRIVLDRPVKGEARPTFNRSAVPLSSKRMDGIVRSILDRVRGSTEGQKHYALRNAALSIGGLLEQAGLSQPDASEQLLHALPGTIKDWNNARATVAWGLEKGRERPLVIEDRPQYRQNGAHHATQHSSSSYPGKSQNTDPPADEDTYAATPFDPALLSFMAPYDWVYQSVMVARYFSVLGAPPGTGKSALIVVVALSIVTGRALLGGDPPAQGNAWIINLEDPADAIYKMVWAACDYYEIDLNSIKGRLFINSGRDKALVVAKLVNGAVWRMPVVPFLTDECKRRNIRALFVDPVVDTHNLPENDNITMNEYCAIWNEVADEANLAVMLSMHFRKGGQSGDPDAFRGASAVIGKARSAITLAVMTPAEADKMGVDPELRRYHLRLDNAKRNLSPPPTKAEWLRLESVSLNNGDNIQTIREWSAPSPWDGLDARQCIVALNAIEAGPSPGEYFTHSRRGVPGPRWAGIPIIKAALPNVLTNSQADTILAQWLKNGVLIEGQYRSAEQRKMRVCVRTDPAKVALMRREMAVEPETPWEAD